MRQSIALVSALAGISFAQSQTLEVFFPGGYEGVDPVATIKEASPQTTAMHLACPSDADPTECGFGVGIDYTIIGDTSIQAVMSDEFYSMSMGCVKDLDKKEVSCQATYSATVTDIPEASINPEDLSSSISTIIPLEENLLTATVVEGAELLSATGSSVPASSATTSAGASSASPSAGNSPTTSAASATASPSSNATTTGTGSAPESTGAASKLVFGGVAVLAMAGAAALNVL